MIRRLASCGVLLAVLLGMARASGADDVPDTVRELYAEARVHEAAGDLKKAYSALSKARSKQPLSVDFWELYVRVWRALDKKEDVLWEKIVGKVEKKHPQSAVFALLRARLAADEEERVRHLRDASAKQPDAVGPQLLLAKALLENGDDSEAEEILDAVLEKHPDHEDALVTKGEMDLMMGRSLSAASYAAEQLERISLAGLHDLRARALLAASETGESRLDEAEAEAQLATTMRDDPRYVRTLVDVLDRKGQLDQAVQLLDESYKRFPAPVLAAKLGELAFRSGDYEKAIRGLAADPEPSTAVLKGLAVAHGRLGDVEAMRRVCARLERRLEENEPTWIGSTELALGDPALALKALGEEGGDDTADYLRLCANSLLGNVEGARALADERARTGQRADEEYLIQLLHARLTARLGAKAEAARQALRAGAVAAAKGSVPGAEAAAEKGSTHANSPEFIERAVSYRRTAGGRWFHASFTEEGITFDVKERGPGRVRVRLGIEGCAECRREPSRWFWFNPVEIRPEEIQNADPERYAKELIGRLLGITDEDHWEATESAFAEGCAALVDESWSRARSAFERVLRAEPEWGRAKLFASVALLLDGADTGQAALEAAEAIRMLPDDYDGQRLLALMELLAGQDPDATIKVLAREEEAHGRRRLEWL